MLPSPSTPLREKIKARKPPDAKASNQARAEGMHREARNASLSCFSFGPRCSATRSRSHLFHLFYQVFIRPHLPPARRAAQRPAARPRLSTAARANAPRGPFTAGSAECSQAASQKRPPPSRRQRRPDPRPLLLQQISSKIFLPRATPARSRTTRMAPRYNTILSILPSPRRRVGSCGRLTVHARTEGISLARPAPPRDSQAIDARLQHFQLINYAENCADSWNLIDHVKRPEICSICHTVGGIISGG